MAVSNMYMHIETIQKIEVIKPKRTITMAYKRENYTVRPDGEFGYYDIFKPAPV